MPTRTRAAQASTSGDPDIRGVADVASAFATKGDRQAPGVRSEDVLRDQASGAEVERLADRHPQHPLRGDPRLAAARDQRGVAALELRAAFGRTGHRPESFGKLDVGELGQCGHECAHIPLVEALSAAVEGLVAQAGQRPSVTEPRALAQAGRRFALHVGPGQQEALTLLAVARQVLVAGFEGRVGLGPAHAGAEEERLGPSTDGGLRGGHHGGGHHRRQNSRRDQEASNHGLPDDWARGAATEMLMPGGSWAGRAHTRRARRTSIAISLPRTSGPWTASSRSRNGAAGIGAVRWMAAARASRETRRP